MRICVSGGAGFIGSHVAEAYLRLGHEVVVLDDLSGGCERNIPKQAEFVKLDIREGDKVDRLFKEKRFDLVNHHAAQVSVPASVKAPFYDASVNVHGLLNVLSASAKWGVQKFIFISSGGTVYGETNRFPIPEDCPLDPRSPYGITKAAGEWYVRFFAQEHGFRWTALRYSNVYGPRQDPHGEAGVVAIFCKQLLKGEPVSIYGLKEPGDGGCFRDYVYVGDVTEANVACIEKGDGEAFNIGTGKQTRTQELFDLLCAVTGKKVPVRQCAPRSGDVPRNSVDPTKALKLLGWKPRVDLEVGLQETYRFFESQGSL